MPHRFIARKIRRFIIYRVLSLDDTPHRIALGVGIGFFVTWTPTIGLQMLLIVALSTLLKANKFVGVPFAWISNPLTLVPVYGPNFLVGRWVLGGGYSWKEFTHAIGKVLGPELSWIGKVGAWWSAMWEVFGPLWVGSIFVGALLGAIVYALTYYGVIKFRRHLHHRREASHPGEQPLAGKED
jgi:hypothetical protein